MKKFLIRLLINIVKFLFIALPLQLIGMIILAIYLPLNPKCRKLPDILAWFDGADQYVGRDTSVYDQVMAGELFLKWNWLAWRNPINYFGYKYLGFELRHPYVSTEYYRSPQGYQDIGNSHGDIPGIYYEEITTESGVYYEYYYVHKYTMPLLKGKCFRFRMGWKLGQNLDMKEGYVQEAFVISPFMSYSGE